MVGKKLKGLKDSGFIADFRKFINKGNVIDMAVGIIIGGAFGKIVSSLVNDIITPIISLVTGQVQLSELIIILKAAQLDIEGNVAVPEVTVRYGLFLQFILDFLIVALFIFLFIRFLTKLKEREEKRAAEKHAIEVAPEPEPEPVPDPEPEPTKEELLLSEIRDLLKAMSE